MKTMGAACDFRGVLGAVKNRTTADAVSARIRPPKTYRGSRRRIERIKWRGNGSLEIGFFVAWVVFLVLVVLPWMIRHNH
jgi:hypothetical protein